MIHGSDLTATPNRPSPIIDFIVRSDSETKSGGDSLQVGEYVERLEKQGISCRVLPYSWDMQVRKGAIVHLVNIDRPYDFLSIVRLVTGHAIFVSPIHHDLRFVRKMRRAETGWSPRSIIGRIFPEGVREFLAFAVRSMAGASSRGQKFGAGKSILRASLDSRRVWFKVGRTLDRLEAVALLTPREGENIKRDTKWRGLNSILVPNGYPTPSFGLVTTNAPPSRSIGILSVGRIEPRKRQVALAEEAVRQGVAITFIGGTPKTGSKYSNEFRRLVNQYPHILTWLESIPHEAVLEKMADSRVLINASWVEVQSLVDIEAAYCGCRVIVAPGGNSTEFLPKHVREIDGGISELLSAAVTARDSVTAPPAMPEPWTWDDAVERILAAY
jgi:glycosyltransferase involved in cell wall biosynthesis